MNVNESANGINEDATGTPTQTGTPGLVLPASLDAAVVHKPRFELPLELRPFEPLIDAINNLELALAYDGPVNLRLRDRSATLPCEIRWGGTEGTIECDDPTGSILGFVGGGQYGVALKPEDFVNIRFDGWTSIDVRFTSRRTDERGTSARGSFGNLTRGTSDPSATFHASVYHGLTFPTYPMCFPSGDDRHSASWDGLLTTAFGRPFLMRAITTTSKQDDPFIVVGHSGELFTNRELTAIWLVLSFLCGREGPRVADLEFDSAGGERFRALHRSAIGGISDRVQPPIRLWGQVWGPALTALPGMFTMAHRLLDENVPIDIALKYLLDAERSVDETLRNLASALDSLVEADAFSPTKTRIVVDDDAYAQFVTDLLPTIKATIEERAFPKELLRRIEERLKGANDVRHGERRRLFWDRVGFELGPREKDALATRHALAHRGFLLRGSSDPEFTAALTHMRVARNLVNRTILALLGYRGPIFDYQTGRNVPFDGQVGE